MKYVSPNYKNEIIASEDIMEFSPNNIRATETTFDYGDGNGEVNVTKGTSTANIKDLLF